MAVEHPVFVTEIFAVICVANCVNTPDNIGRILFNE